MKKIAVLADSGCQLPIGSLEDQGIYIVPLTITMGNKTYLEYQEKYHDATHNCIAYIVGTQKRANDNGEPSGTAGLPMLDVLEKNKLTNIIAIVTRY